MSLSIISNTFFSYVETKFTKKNTKLFLFFFRCIAWRSELAKTQYRNIFATFFLSNCRKLSMDEIVFSLNFFKSRRQKGPYRDRQSATLFCWKSPVFERSKSHCSCFHHHEEKRKIYDNYCVKLLLLLLMKENFKKTKERKNTSFYNIKLEYFDFSWLFVA